ncbi:MAG: 7TM domain-containing protein [Patescibacteria group bacterium]
MITRRLLILLIILLGTFVITALPSARTQFSFAQDTEVVTGEVDLEAEEDATDSAEEATESASTATRSAEVQQRVEERREQDITTSGGSESRLVMFLNENPPDPLSWNNFIQHGVRYAISQGVSPNTIVLVLLFPLIASLIAASRHVIGLRGFGIYIPAVLSVALVATGIWEGLMIFLAIVGTSLLASRIVLKMKLSYLPRTALLLWMISLGILGTFFIAPSLGLVNLLTVNIFPILILVLLAENFLDAQTRTKQLEALAITIETLVLAAICGLLLQWEPMHRLSLVEPELLLLGTAAINIIIGKFVGLRLSERFRFRSIIEE